MATKVTIFLSGPPRVSQSGVELEKIFECDFIASEDAYGSYKPYGKVRLKFGPLFEIRTPLALVTAIAVRQCHFLRT